MGIVEDLVSQSRTLSLSPSSANYLTFFLPSSHLPWELHTTPRFPVPLIMVNERSGIPEKVVAAAVALFASLSLGSAPFQWSHSQLGSFDRDGVFLRSSPLLSHFFCRLRSICLDFASTHSVGSTAFCVHFDAGEFCRKGGDSGIVERWGKGGRGWAGKGNGGNVEIGLNDRQGYDGRSIDQGGVRPRPPRLPSLGNCRLPLARSLVPHRILAAVTSAQDTFHCQSSGEEGGRGRGRRRGVDSDETTENGGGLVFVRVSRTFAGP